jgi:hypothetical protein
MYVLQLFGDAQIGYRSGSARVCCCSSAEESVASPRWNRLEWCRVPGRSPVDGHPLVQVPSDLRRLPGWPASQNHPAKPRNLVGRSKRSVRRRVRNKHLRSKRAKAGSPNSGSHAAWSHVSFLGYGRLIGLFISRTLGVSWPRSRFQGAVGCAIVGGSMCLKRTFSGLFRYLVTGR